MSDHLISADEANENLLAFAARLAEDIKSAEGHADALKSIVPMYLDRNNVDLAAQLADTVDDPFTRDRLLSQVAERCAEIDDVDYAFQLAEAVEDVGIQAETVERIAIRQIAKGRIEEALATAETLDHPVNVYAEAAYRYLADGDAANAEKMVALIDFPAVRSSTLQTIAATHFDAERKSEALAAADKAVDAATEIDFETDEIRALTDIGNLMTRIGRRDRAIETLDKARVIAEKLDSVHREYLLSAVSLGFFNAGSVDLADRTLDLISDKTHLAATLLGFARGYWEREEREDAVDALEEAYQIIRSQHEKETRDSRAKFQLWRSIAVQFAGFGRDERAFEASDELVDEGERFDARAEMAQIFTMQNSGELAEDALRSIGDESKRMFALVGVGDVKRRLGDDDAALAFYRRAEEMIDSVPQLPLRSTAFNELTARFIAHGLNDEARSLAHRNLETIVAIKDESVRVGALAALAALYEQAGFSMTDEERRILGALLRKVEW